MKQVPRACEQVSTKINNQALEQIIFNERNN